MARSWRAAWPSAPGAARGGPCRRIARHGHAYRVVLPPARAALGGVLRDGGRGAQAQRRAARPRGGRARAGTASRRVLRRLVEGRGGCGAAHELRRQAPQPRALPRRRRGGRGGRHRRLATPARCSSCGARPNTSPSRAPSARTSTLRSRGDRSARSSSPTASDGGGSCSATAAARSGCWRAWRRQRCTGAGPRHGAAADGVDRGIERAPRAGAPARRRGGGARRR